MRFENKVAVITGGASGIGAATAGYLAREGATVVVVDRDCASSHARALADEFGTALKFAAADVTDAEQSEHTAEQIVREHSRIDVLVTCAGIISGRALVDTDETHWDHVFAVNVKGTFLWMRAVLPAMVRARGGAIVTVASQLAFAGARDNAAYVASKGAIVSLTKTAALEHAQDGVRINAVAPGATQTPMVAARYSDNAEGRARRQRTESRHAMQRLGQPEEIAAAIAYLASDEASFTTGVVLPVDGGWLVA